MPKRNNEEAEPQGGWRFALRALEHRNYKLFFSGQSVSLIGTWMTRLATSWLVYRLTQSAFLLGLVGFASQIPLFVLGPFAGVWVDRLNRRTVLVVTQALSMLQSLWLAELALRHVITIHEIIWLSLFQGLINAFDMPARQAFVVQMVNSREDLPSAIALNSSMVNGARLIGPSIAGAVIALAGEGMCFLIDGLSYLAVIASLLLMHITRLEERKRETHVREDLVEGWRYVTRSVAIRSILLLLSLFSLVGTPYMVLLPIYAAQILHGGAHTLGFLTGAVGIGALISAGALASRRSVLGLGPVIAYTAVVFGAALMAFAYSRWLWLSLLLLIGTGFGMMQNMAASNTILQTIVEEDKRGRVMSFYSMAFAGMAPFGSLLAGAVANRIGSPATLAVCGVICAAGGAWFWRKLPAIREHVRPIYRQLGILPEVAQGMRVATERQ
jgi:MFS family permease